MKKALFEKHLFLHIFVLLKKRVLEVHYLKYPCFYLSLTSTSKHRVTDNGHFHALYERLVHLTRRKELCKHRMCGRGPGSDLTAWEAGLIGASTPGRHCFSAVPESLNECLLGATL